MRAARVTNTLVEIWLEVNALIKTSQLRMHKKWTSATPVAGSQVAAAFNNDSSANYSSQSIGFMTGPNMTFPMVLQTVGSKTPPCAFPSADLQQVFWLKKKQTKTNKR